MPPPPLCTATAHPTVSSSSPPRRVPRDVCPSPSALRPVFTKGVSPSTTSPMNVSLWTSRGVHSRTTGSSIMATMPQRQPPTSMRTSSRSASSSTSSTSPPMPSSRTASSSPMPISSAAIRMTSTGSNRPSIPETVWSTTSLPAEPPTRAITISPSVISMSRDI